ncbi:replication initiation protein [Candidatus Electronema sp. PJ]|uniref:replication initiation protein n=1 Tax=Candidatus Electronema sp. PJ TaxID=3401572 RepID=UPI003AA9DCAC
MDTKKPTLNSPVAKSNDIVPVMSKYDLQELRLIAYCIAHYDSRQPDNRRFTAKVTDLATIFDMAEDSAYSVIKRVVTAMSKPFAFMIDSKEKYIWWFQEFEYIPGNGEVMFMLNTSMIPYLLELKERFSVYRLADVHQFKAASTWHLFENLNRWKNAGGWHVTLNDLHSILGADGKYPRFDSFRQRLIDPAIAEINEKSSLNVEYVKETSGKTVIALRFFIDSKQPDYVITIESQKNKLLKLLLGCGIRNHLAEKIIDQIVGAEKEAHFIKKLPEMQKRWSAEKGSMPRYVAGAVKRELAQRSSKAEDKAKPEHAESLSCWLNKRRHKEVCKVRQRGGLPYRKKCQICLSRIPVVDFGL